MTKDGIVGRRVKRIVRDGVAILERIVVPVKLVGAIVRIFAMLRYLLS